MSKIGNRLNNVSFRYKMFSIYYLCILIPNIILSIVFSISLVQYFQDKYDKSIQANVDFVNSKIERSVNIGMLISDQIYANKDIIYNIFNSPQKTDTITRYDNTIAIDNYVNSLIVNSIQKSVMIYTENENVNNGIYITRLNDATKYNEWYESYMSDGQNKFFFTYTNIYGTTTLSFIRSLDFVNTEKHSFVKIDFDIDEILNESVQNDFTEQFLIIDENTNIVYPKSEDSPKAIGEKKLDKYIASNMSIPPEWKIISPKSSYSFASIIEPKLIIIFVLFLILLALSSIWIFYITNNIKFRLTALTQTIKKAKDEQFEKVDPALISKDEIGILADGINITFSKIEYLINEVYHSKIKNTEIMLESKKNELNALYSQINPHFLFNIMEAIRLRAVMKGEKETGEILKTLSKFYRNSLMWTEHLITVEKELTLIREYLSIQNFRFNGTLEYNIVCAPEAYSLKIPKMLIQIFVENSCTHAFYSMDTEKINIRIDYNGDKLSILIEDNGHGITQEAIDNIYKRTDTSEDKHIGIPNILKRLSLFYNDNYSFLIENIPSGGTRVLITIQGEEINNV